MYRGNNYRHASDSFKFRISPVGMESYSIPPTAVSHDTHNTHNPHNTHKPSSNIIWQNKVINMDTRDPEVFGPAFWFTLHNGSIRYPEEASPIVLEKMKGFILGLPYMVPCENCQSHAISYIEKHYDELSEVCKGQKNLFKFFFDFHNYVNKRLGKPEMSFENAWQLYSGGTNLKVMKYN